MPDISSQLFALEPRWMFDGAAVVDLAADPSGDSSVTVPLSGPNNAQRTEVTFIDSGLQDSELIANSIGSLTQVVFINANSSGLEQMATWLSDKSNVDAIHIIGHGKSGEALIGNSRLTIESLADFSNELKTIGSSLNESGDILLYGCDIGSNNSGINFVQSLAQITEADVAASNNITGTNGDWNLEVQSGEINTALPESLFSNYSYDLASGSLTLVESYKDGVNGLNNLQNLEDVIVSPDGKHLYALASWSDTLSVFSRDASTGKLTLVEQHKDDSQGGAIANFDYANRLAISADGKSVYVGASGDPAISLFSRNSTTGALTFVETHKADGTANLENVRGIYDIALSADGKNLYVTSSATDAISVWTRNTTTGSLTFLESHKDDSRGGTAGTTLTDTRYVTVSPDGKSVYATSFQESGVSVFSRNATTGALTFVEAHIDNTNGVDGLQYAYDVAVSPNNNFVYVAGRNEYKVAVFSRDSATSKLTFSEVLSPGAATLYPGVLTFAPDGNDLFVGNEGGKGLVDLTASSSTGKLTYAESEKQHSDGSLLTQIYGVAVSPDNKFVYAADRNKHTISVFSRVASSPTTTSNDTGSDSPAPKPPTSGDADTPQRPKNGNNDGPVSGAGLATVNIVPPSTYLISTDGNFLNQIDNGLGNTPKMQFYGYKAAYVPTDSAVTHETGLFVYQGIPSLKIDGRSVSFVVPTDAFGQRDPEAPIYLSARLTDGGALPNWLRFDAQSGTFLGEVPIGYSGIINVLVSAQDDQGNEATTSFQLLVSGDGLEKIQQPSELNQENSSLQNREPSTLHAEISNEQKESSISRKSTNEPNESKATVRLNGRTTLSEQFSQDPYVNGSTRS